MDHILLNIDIRSKDERKDKGSVKRPKGEWIMARINCLFIQVSGRLIDCFQSHSLLCNIPCKIDELIIVTIWNLWCESRVPEFRNVWIKWSNIYYFPWYFNAWIMNKRNKGKSYVKDNLGILNAVWILFVCFIGPVVYWFTFMVAWSVRNYLKLNACPDHGWIKGRWGVGGG